MPRLVLVAVGRPSRNIPETDGQRRKGEETAFRLFEPWFGQAVRRSASRIFTVGLMAAAIADREARRASGCSPAVLLLDEDEGPFHQED
jgi:hypothetical protein